jgi:hypothetical protein
MIMRGRSLGLSVFDYRQDRNDLAAILFDHIRPKKVAMTTKIDGGGGGGCGVV